MEMIVAGFKDVQDRYGQKWQKIQKGRNSLSLMNQQLKDKGNELCKWYLGQAQSLMHQVDKLATDKEKANAQDQPLMECKALLDTKEKGILAREEALAATLRGKDDELETLVQ